MKWKLFARAAAAAAGLMLCGCGQISFRELSAGVTTPYPNPVPICAAATSKLTAVMTAESLAVSPKTSILPTTVYSRVATVERAIQPALQQEGVVWQNSVLHEILNATNTTAYQTHSNLAQLASLQTSQPPPPTSPPHDLTMSDFLVLASTVKRLLLDAQTLQKTTDKDLTDFQKYFLLYFSNYFKGTYIDRFGNPISAPAVSTTLGDSEIAGTMTVLVDLIMDYVLRTPVWVDNVKAPKTYYPGGTGNEPTVAAAFPDLITPIVLEPGVAGASCGITKLKTEAIHYVAVSAGNRASLLVGAIGGSFGGIDVGLGVLGKVSIGDNKTLQTLAKTALDIAFTHLGEYASYQVLYVVPNLGPPKPKDQSEVYYAVLKYVQAFLDAQQKATSAASG